MSAGRKVNTNSCEYNTPPNYIEVIKNFFGSIHLDPCSNEFSKVEAEHNISLPTDGLLVDWSKHRTIFVNPPYGRQKNSSIKDWFRKAVSAYIKGSDILMLVPVATNTSAWKEYVFGKAVGICFLADTRVKFWLNGEEIKKGAPMSCALVYYGGDFGRFNSYFSPLGYCVRLSEGFELRTQP